MTDMAFGPAEVAAEVAAKGNRQIRLLFRNEGQLSHDFTTRWCLPEPRPHLLGYARLPAKPRERR